MDYSSDFEKKIELLSILVDDLDYTNYLLDLSDKDYADLFSMLYGTIGLTEMRKKNVRYVICGEELKMKDVIVINEVNIDAYLKRYLETLEEQILESKEYYLDCYSDLMGLFLGLQRDYPLIDFTLALMGVRNEN